MSLTPGVRLGVYEILAAIGAGGMGEVYRARDTKLGRDVALKILPESFVHDLDRIARFRREAQVLASLNHPHIAAIYGLDETTGSQVLVLELVEGGTLAQRLMSGPLPLDDALTVARQIADALESAHDKGVIHRDLKPANIAFTPDGQVKVLDFGLAKELERGVGSNLTNSPTLTLAATRAGVILGTAAYMAPEQAKGRAADKRSDIWAFGCVLYEILTGKRAFEGEEITDTLAAVLRAEPDWTALPPSTPTAIRRLLLRCLEKDLRRRLHDFADARIEIDDGATDRTAGIAAHWPPWPTLALAAIGLLGVGVATGVFFSRVRSAGPASDSGISARYSIAVSGLPNNEAPAVSQDGRRIAFVARSADGAQSLWIKDLDAERPRELMGTSGAVSPFWSPDGRSIGFFAEGALKRVDLAGGSPQRLYRVEESFGGTWGATGVIVFSQRYALYQIPASGGTPSVVARVDLSRQENSLRSPEFLADGRRFLYVARSGRPENTGAYLASIEGRPAARLFSTRSAVRATAAGDLLYVRDETLVTQRLDPDRQSTLSEPRPVAGPISPTLLGPLDFFSVSNNGVLVYAVPVPHLSQLAWVDRAGRNISTLGKPALIANFRLSPDEQRLVADEADQGSRSIWVIDLVSGARSRLTFPGSDDWQPIWSPDGSRVLFGSYRDGPLNLYIKPVSGAGRETPFLLSESQKGPRDWSRDGAFVLYTLDSPEMKEDLLARAAEGPGEPTVIAATPAREFGGRFSPDGHHVAYVSNEGGRDEIYVQPFPPNGGKWQISNGGGDSPRWRGDGRELFYLTPTRAMVAIPIVTQPSFAAGQPHVLFEMAGIDSGAPGATSYEVTRDGQRFLLRLASGSAPPTSINVLLNWRRVP